MIEIHASDFDVHCNAAPDILQKEAMNRTSALIRLEPGGEGRHYQEPSLAGKLFGLPGQSMLYLLDLIRVFPTYSNFPCVLPYNPQRKDQTHDIESGKDNEKNVQ